MSGEMLAKILFLGAALAMFISGLAGASDDARLVAGSIVFCGGLLWSRS